MAPLYYSFIPLYLVHLFIRCQAQYELSIAPQNPVVPLGTSVQLNCSINCPGGSTTWKGLDTNLGGLYFGTGFSVLNIQNASISMGGNMICVGSCPEAGKKLYYNSVFLHVYALPETLLLSAHPEEEPPSLHCFMRAVYVTSDITVKWFKGLESLEASKQEEKWYEDEDGLSYYTWILPGTEKWEPGTSYHCEAEIVVGGYLFTRKGILQLPQKAVIRPATCQDVDLHATSAASSTIMYTIPSFAGYPKTLHKVPSPTLGYKSRLSMNTATQTVPKSASQSYKKLVTATIPSSMPGSSNPVRRFSTVKPIAFLEFFQTLSSMKRNTNLLTEYPTVSTNVNIRSYSKPLTANFQGTPSADVAYHTTEQGSSMKEGQTSLSPFNTQPDNPKTESLTSVSAEESTAQMKSEHLFTTLPLVHQNTAVIRPATFQDVDLHATSAASSTIMYTIPSFAGHPKTLHKVSSPSLAYKSRLSMNTATQTVPKSASESHKKLVTATIPSSMPGSSNPVRRFPTVKLTLLLTEYPTVSTNVNIRSYSKPLTADFQGTSSAAVAYHTTEQGSSVKEGQTSLSPYNTQPDNPKIESLTYVSAEESTTQMKSIEHLFTTLPLVHQSKSYNTNVRLSPTPWPTVKLQFVSSQGIRATNKSAIQVVPSDRLALAWAVVPTLGLIGSLMLSFRLWTALRRKGSFISASLNGQ